MYYYKHKQTGNIIGSLNNIRDLVDCDGNRIGCITDVVIPNKIVGNGVICHIMSYGELRKGYKKTNKKEALSMYPDFGQYRHRGDTKNFSVTYLGERYLDELKPIRKSDYGI